jgi:hypothetical protein
MCFSTLSLNKTVQLQKFFSISANQYNFRTCTTICQGERTADSSTRSGDDSQTAIKTEGRRFVGREVTRHF